MKKSLLIAATFIAVLFLIPQYGSSQESNANQMSLTRKQEKEQKKKAKEAAALADREKYAKLLQDKQYVFMANSLSGDAGATYSITPKFNFLKVAGESVVFQFAFDGLVGWNGIGGMTIVGELEDYRFDPGKSIKKPMRVNARIEANVIYGKPYVTMTVFEEGYARITVTIKGGTLNMSGQVVSLEDADVYTGSENYIVK